MSYSNNSVGSYGNMGYGMNYGYGVNNSNNSNNNVGYGMNNQSKFYLF
jgi:hypothetical protein